MNIESNKNEDGMRLAMSQLNSRFEKVALGGGKKAIEKQHTVTEGRNIFRENDFGRWRSDQSPFY